MSFMVLGLTTDDASRHFSQAMESMNNVLERVCSERWLEHYQRIEQHLTREPTMKLWVIVGWIILTLFIIWKTWRLCKNT